MPTSTTTCDSCINGKQSHERAAKTSDRRSFKPLALIHTDLCDIIRLQSLAVSLYFVTSLTISRASHGYIFCVWNPKLFWFSRSSRFKVEKLLGCHILCSCSDRGREFLSNDFINICDNEGISRELTKAYIPHQNGISERKNQTLLENAHAMITDAPLLVSCGPRQSTLPIFWPAVHVPGQMERSLPITNSWLGITFV